MGLIASLIKYLLQPIIMILSLWYWFENRESDYSYLLIFVALHFTLGFIEYRLPARRDWVQPFREKFVNVCIVLSMSALAGSIAILYKETLLAPLAALRIEAGVDIWPHHFPVLVQVFMVFLLSEFIWYWLHRAEHRFSFFWKLSGHGAHHSFKRLGAINFGANHPLEAFLIVLPAAIVELTFGVGEAAAGSAILAGVLASVAHANIKMNTQWIGLIFTTNSYHIHHHSIVLEESNTNYGCSAIIWDRVFGTFEDKPTLETGTGPTEPTLWQKFKMPVQEPVDTETAPVN